MAAYPEPVALRQAQEPGRAIIWHVAILSYRLLRDRSSLKKISTMKNNNDGQGEGDRTVTMRRIESEPSPSPLQIIDLALVRRWRAGDNLAHYDTFLPPASPALFCFLRLGGWNYYRNGNLPLTD